MSESVIVAAYCDGGCVGGNPSDQGVTWAYCLVDATGARVAHDSGVIPAPTGRALTNNQAEYAAAVRALEALPPGWSGPLYSDSAVTLGRLCRGWATNGLPPAWVTRAQAALDRLGPLRPVLLQGHPTKTDLEQGIGKKRGFPVSIHNCWCDEECTKAARAYLAQREAAPR
jgi:ribonuclease HI